MTADRNSNRYIVMTNNQPFANVFFDEGKARKFVQDNKESVTQFLHESLVSEFDGYFVWSQTLMEV